MSEKLNKVVESLLDQARRLQGTSIGERRYEEVDLDDERLRLKLMAVAKTRALQMDDVDRALEEIDADVRAEIQREGRLHEKCNERRDDLKVYYVTNTADRQLTVLARDAQCARRFAFYHGHIQNAKNGKVMVLKPEHEAALRVSGKALGRALRDGYPGVVTEMGDNVVMERSKKVYAPMTVVKPEGLS